MARRDEEPRTGRVEVRLEVDVELDLEHVRPEEFDGWRGKHSVGTIAEQVAREAFRNDRLDPSRLRDTPDVEGRVRILQVRAR